jgi:hypothetical protein
VSASQPHASRARLLDPALVLAAALLSRAAVVLWAAGRIPPAADGKYYHVIASRLAEGLGYTWLWPDGVVTYAAHYPVGYPAMLGAVYALAGPRPAAAMMLNALLGAASALAAWALARRATSRRGALIAGLLASLHVGLVAYTPALMTEGVTASLLVIGAWQAARSAEAQPRSRIAWLLSLGLVMGLATLVRPQSLVLAPPFAWFAVGADAGALARSKAAAWVTAAALAVCLPWVLRNHLRMGHAALSFNGGWNLLIGTQASGQGGWAPVEVPSACREVFHEAEKDLCFGREALRQLVAHPFAWLRLVPAKLSTTFDYCGGAGWYLHEANPSAFPEAFKVRLGVLETVFERAVLLAALVSLAMARGVRRTARLALGAGSVLACLTHWAWVGYLGLVALVACFGKDLRRLPVAAPAAAAAILSTAVTHGVFFGSGRYSMVVFPLVTALACGLLTQAAPPVHTPAEGDLVDAPH